MKTNRPEHNYLKKKHICIEQTHRSPLLLLGEVVTDFALYLADEGKHFLLTSTVIPLRRSPPTQAVLPLSLWLTRCPGYVVHGRPVCPHPCSLYSTSKYVQGADDKLGHFLDQDI